MPRIDIPGREPLQLTHALFDLNGTLALDGQILPDILPLFQKVCEEYHCLVLTGDTFGTGSALGQVLGCPVRTIGTGADKAQVVRGLEGGVAAVGNGRNDVPMLQAAALAIVVVGPEGAAAQAISAADIVLRDIQSALELLLSPKRLVATLRP